MLLNRFCLSSEEAELLILFEELSDIAMISQRTGRDPSGLSRAIKRLAEKYPVIEKRAGRWQLTPLGAEVNTISRSFLQAQASVLKRQARIRIGTNREFASRVVAPRLGELERLLPGTRLDLLSYENGVEQALKVGLIDLGLDCGRPTDPAVNFKSILKEPIAPYCSKGFMKAHKRAIEALKWEALPHILCERLFPDRIMDLSDQSWRIASHVNDVATARELAQAGSGWALLPNYAVDREVQRGVLVRMGPQQYESEKYGIWWLRERKFLQPTIVTLSNWMKTLEI